MDKLKCGLEENNLNSNKLNIHDTQDLELVIPLSVEFDGMLQSGSSSELILTEHEEWILRRSQSTCSVGSISTQSDRY